ncbi:MAG: DUF1573 domain-containing protein [Chitinophagaceae bacterium]
MQRIVFFIISILLTSCFSNNDPYSNNLGIKSSIVAQLDTANYTTIFWEDSVKNFGIIKSRDSILIKFNFKNTGSKPLFISEVRPSCGCTVVSYPQDLIQPGKTKTLTATFNTFSYHSGYVRKTINVVSNTKNNTHHYLIFYGEIKDSTDFNK